MPILLGLTGFAIDRAHHSSLLQAEQDRLQLHFFGLLGAIEWRDGQIEMGDRLKEPRFWQFRSGLYGEIQSKQQQLWRSLSSETIKLNAELSQPAPGQALFGQTQIDQQRFFYYRFLALWETERGEEIPLLISLYSQQDSLQAELNRFRRQLLIWLSVVLFFSLILSSLLLYWGLSPLRSLAKDLLRLEQGESRQLNKHYPRELASLTNNLNKLLESEQRQRERYRNTLGDLAHSLKTPLAVLKSQPEDPVVEQQQLERMENIITYQLNRAVTSSKHGLQQNTPLRPLLQSLQNSLYKVYHQKALTINLDIPDDSHAPLDSQDLMEVLGNLLDNACKACMKRIDIAVEGNTIYIDDDGPGISDSQVKNILDRGRRGDQYGQGQGLGLAIVREILDSYHADLSFSKSHLGGCRLRITFAET